MKQGYVYILASKPNGTIYIGVTSNLIKRIYEHKANVLQGFTQTHEVHQLVYFEITESIETAIEREKQLKNWRRSWKKNLIEKNNSDWRDLYTELVGKMDAETSSA